MALTPTQRAQAAARARRYRAAKGMAEPTRGGARMADESELVRQLREENAYLRSVVDTLLGAVLSVTERDGQSVTRDGERDGPRDAAASRRVEGVGGGLSLSNLSLTQEIKGLGGEIQDRNGARASANSVTERDVTSVTQGPSRVTQEPPSQDPGVPPEASSSTHPILRSQPTTPSQTSVHKTGQVKAKAPFGAPVTGSMTGEAATAEATRQVADLLLRAEDWEREKTETNSKGVH